MRRPGDRGAVSPVCHTLSLMARVMVERSAPGVTLRAHRLSGPCGLRLAAGAFAPRGVPPPPASAGPGATCMYSSGTPGGGVPLPVDVTVIS